MQLGRETVNKSGSRTEERWAKLARRNCEHIDQQPERSIKSKSSESIKAPPKLVLNKVDLALQQNSGHAVKSLVTNGLLYDFYRIDFRCIWWRRLTYFSTHKLV
jgi:hypothetical protein